MTTATMGAATMKRQRPAKRDLNNLNGLRVALYCRVSKDDDKDTDNKEKSVEDQEAEGRRWVERQGAVLAEVYSDNDRSASRFAKREREHFARLLADIDAGKLDVIWFWELSRSQRRLDVFAKLRDRCRDLGVLWAIRDRVYDPAAYADTMTLGMLSVVGEMESELTSERVRRGLESNAVAGKVHAWAPYGYRRIYDPISRQLVRQEANVFDGDGAAVQDSPAYIVREIFERVAAGHSISSIEKSLNARSVPTPAAGRGGQAWYHGTILYIARSATYLGQRIYQGEVLEGVTAVWPALVDQETFWSCQRVLSDPARPTKRPARSRHLLSGVVTCLECDGEIRVLPRTDGHPRYTCRKKFCTSISEPALDKHVETVVKRWLSDPQVFADLTQMDDSATAAQARADAEQLRAELEECRHLAERREMSPVLASRMESSLLARIDEAEGREQQSALPAVLRGNIGPEAAARWDRGISFEVKRQIITAIADIRLMRAPGRRHGVFHPVDRLTWTWLLGPDQANASA